MTVSSFPLSRTFGAAAAYIRALADVDVTYNPETLLCVWDSLVSQAGVSVLFHSIVIDVLAGPAGSEVTGLLIANMTRVENIDPTDVQALSLAEVEGRRQVGEYVRFLQNEIPGYEAAELVGIGMHIGIRESRRIHGDYQLTEDDVLSATRFDDAIASCGAPIEDHTGGTDTVWKYIPDSRTYDIPYRVLLPIGLDNVIVAGRRHRCRTRSSGRLSSSRALHPVAAGTHRA